jgi:CelD/BcsL family acetyltransferase involved in cellulose biosynthesis
MTDADPGRREEWIGAEESFAELRDEWNELAGSPFLTWDWLDAYWRAFGIGQPRVYVGWTGSELSAGMAFGLRRGHLRAMAGTDTDLCLPVTRSASDRERVVEAIASGPWSRVTLPFLPLEDPFIDDLTSALERRGWLTHRPALPVESPIVDTSGSFEDYGQRVLSANARRQIGKGRRRLEKKGTVELRVLREVEELEPVLEECFALEAAGSKGRRGSAILSSEQMTRFMGLAYERFQERGAVRFSELRLDGELIAFDISFIQGRVFYALKTSYDESYEYFAPGHILRLGILEECFGREIDSHEFLYPRSRWKARYTQEGRLTTTLRAYRRRPLSLARYAGRRWAMPVLVPAVERLYDARRRLLERRGQTGSKDA